MISTMRTNTTFLCICSILTVFFVNMSQGYCLPQRKKKPLLNNTMPKLKELLFVIIHKDSGCGSATKTR